MTPFFSEADQSSGYLESMDQSASELQGLSTMPPFEDALNVTQEATTTSVGVTIVTQGLYALSYYFTMSRIKVVFQDYVI